MKENTYYFPHDYNAHKDPKCGALINDFGLAGYGLYWSIIEILHEQGGKLKKFPKLLEGIAFQLNVEKEQLTKQVEAMLNDYELLSQDDNYIWSDRVLRNFEERKNKYLLKSEAGRRGGIKSGILRKKRSKTKQNEAVLEANEANEAKERKGKERKVNNISSSSDDGEQKKFLSNDQFLSFWSEYPRKVGKEEGRKKFVKLDASLYGKIMEALRKQKTKWQDPKYIPHPSTWLNQHRWEDEETKLTPEQEIKELINECAIKSGKDNAKDNASFKWEKICKERGLDFLKYIKMFD